MNRHASPICGVVRATFLVAALAVGAFAAPALADNLLPSEPVEAKDSHISWHDFRHELGNYPQVQASMSSDGVITLSGHASDGIEKRRIEALARKVEGATEITNGLIAD